jgi:hypothetical protein
VIPIGISKDWNLLVRWIAPIVYQPVPNALRLQIAFLFPKLTKEQEQMLLEKRLQQMQQQQQQPQKN